MAETESKKSACHHKLGAVLVRNKEIISTGYNKALSMDKVLTRYGMFYSMHAEMDAVRKVFEVPSGSTIYVARKDFKMSRPCVNCLKVLKNAGIYRIVYSTGEGVALEKLW